MRSGSSSLAVLALLLAAPPLRASFTVSPASIYAEVNAGEKYVAELVVHGPGARYDFEADSFIVDVDGKPQRGMRPSRTSVDWLRLTSSNHKTEIAIDVPPEARGSFWCAVVVGEHAGTPEGVSARIVVPVFITVRGTESRDLSIISLSGRVANDEIVVAALLRNDGNTLARLQMNASIDEVGGQTPREVASSDDLQIVVLPGTARTVKLRFAISPATRHSLIATLSVRYGPSANDVTLKTCRVVSAERNEL